MFGAWAADWHIEQGCEQAAWQPHEVVLDGLCPLFLPVDESLAVRDERRAALVSDPRFSDVGGRTLFAPFPRHPSRPYCKQGDSVTC